MGSLTASVPGACAVFSSGWLNWATLQRCATRRLDRLGHGQRISLCVLIWLRAKQLAGRLLLTVVERPTTSKGVRCHVVDSPTRICQPRHLTWEDVTQITQQRLHSRF